MSQGGKQPREKVLRLLPRIEAELTPWLQGNAARWEWAGSVRRERPMVGDLDLVVCLAEGATGDAGLGHALRPLAGGGLLELDGQTKKSLRLRGSGIKLEVYVARPRAPDLFGGTPGNWGVLLATATGSLEWNIGMTRAARALGLRYSPFLGLVREADGVVLPCETEEELYSRLGMDWVPPKEREAPEGIPDAPR